MKWYHKFIVKQEKISWIGMDEITLWDVSVSVKNVFTGVILNSVSANRIRNGSVDHIISRLKNSLKSKEKSQPIDLQKSDKVSSGADLELYFKIKYILENHYINNPDPDIMYEICDLIKSPISKTI